ncbi:MAG: NERD domain-containing protein [Candidatus Helarchaeota archaeon]
MSIQKCLPGIYPRNDITEKSPVSEKKVYNFLKAEIPKGWYAWHSMKLRTSDNRFAEADFVIAAPERGILILEVKGGMITKRGGHWYQNEEMLKTSPLDQGHRCRRILADRFREMKVEYPELGVVACFPDTFVGKGPTQDDLRGLIIGKESLPYLGKMLPEMIKLATPLPRRTRGGWIKELHSMWCESWVPHPQLCLKAKLDMRRHAQLSLEQFEALCRIIENDKVLVKGGAGTGKTLLAMELAKKEAEEGRCVLVLCFTDALGFELARTLGGVPNITAAPVGKFALKLLRDKGMNIEESYTPEFWNPITLQAALDGMPDIEARWDTVIVDEGQDMGENDWCLIEKCAEKRERLWIFMDDTQGFLEGREVPGELEKQCVKYRLERPYRCPEGIQALADAYIGKGRENLDEVESMPELSTMREAVETKIIRVIGCEKQRAHKAVGREISMLLGEGFKRPEIAVISLRGINLEENIIHRGKIGIHRVVWATDERAKENIVCDTFMRFKGLERLAVIVTDLRYVKDRLGIRMNIALTRATGVVRIVADEEALKQDPILSMLMKKQGKP